MPTLARQLLAGATLPAIAVTALVAQPAEAAPASGSGGTQASTPGNLAASLLSSCYSGAYRTFFQQGGWGGEAGPFRTTTRCRDINVRNDSVFPTNACVVFVDRTNGCNYWTFLPAKSGWFVAATNVRDGVNFRVRFSNNDFQYDPLISVAAY